jgi:energy-coupling factor transport system permease protein
MDDNGRPASLSLPSKAHPGPWMAWTASAAGVALLTRNPWQLVVVGLAALGARWRHSGQPPGRAQVVLYAGLVIFPAGLNFLLSRAGTTVLWRLRLPLIGGPFTLEALLFGLTAGIQIATLLTVMMAFGEAVSSTDLLRRVPRSLYPVGLTASIGLGFAPQARQAFQQIREAQEARGFHPTGWRNLPELVVPLVVISLENALAMGEAMASRGWGSVGLGRSVRWSLSAGWLLLAGGMVLWLVAPTSAWASAALILAGIGLITVSGRGLPRPTRLRTESWNWQGTLACGLSLGSLSVYLLVTFLLPDLLIYYPYPTAAWPALTPALLLAAVPLAIAPAMLPHD